MLGSGRRVNQQNDRSEPPVPGKCATTLASQSHNKLAIKSYLLRTAALQGVSRFHEYNRSLTKDPLGCYFKLPSQQLVANNQLQTLLRVDFAQIDSIHNEWIKLIVDPIDTFDDDDSPERLLKNACLVSQDMQLLLTLDCHLS